jgi:hypothetical protein
MGRSVVARVGPATGIIGVVIVLIGYSVHGYPPMNATGSELVRWTQSTDPAVFSLGVYLEAVGIILFLIFFTWLCVQLWATPSRPWLAAAAFGGALLWGGSSMLENATFSALLSAGRSGVDGQSLVALHAVALNIGGPAGVAMALAMIGTGLAGLEATALPPWLTWPAIAIGLGWAVPSQLVIEVAGFALFVWIGVVAVRSLVWPPAAITGPPGAA